MVFLPVSSLMSLMALAWRENLAWSRMEASVAVSATVSPSLVTHESNISPITLKKHMVFYTELLL